MELWGTVAIGVWLICSYILYRITNNYMSVGTSKNLLYPASERAQNPSYAVKDDNTSPAVGMTIAAIVLYLFASILWATAEVMITATEMQRTLAEQYLGFWDWFWYVRSTSMLVCLEAIQRAVEALWYYPWNWLG
jgi:hypothetical protein